MCGLIFLCRTQLSPADLSAAVRRSLNRLAHRGPDSSGLWLGDSVAIGHRRLAIIDLDSSTQPMTDPDGRFVLAYNGELYNYQELRAALQNQWTFRTSGDTEVVLAGLALQGSAFLKQMEGMWAIAFWDIRTETALFARDRTGKKPLFYRRLPNGFACASEIPALSGLSDTPWQEDLDSTSDYFRYGYYLPGTTAYKDVHEVRPGCVLEWRSGSAPREYPFWSLSIGSFLGTKADAKELLREKLIQAVKRRLIADVEIGAFLSGGIDSSLIVGILRKELGISPRTFTIGFSESSYDERSYAAEVVKRYDTRHQEECIEDWDRELLNKLLLHHVGQPFSDSSLLPTACLSRLAARHVKVALSGDGGDELFSGYQRYQARTFLRWYTRLPRPLRGGIEALIGALPEPMSHHSRSILKKAHLFKDIAKRGGSGRPYVAPLLYGQEELARLAPGLWNRGHLPPNLPEESKPDELVEMMAADAIVYLPQDILAKVDRASMAYSLETRSPFLDRDVVEFAFSLPRHWHRNFFGGKRLLKQTFSDLLPSSISQRRKQGFGVPISHWFNGSLGVELEQRIKECRELPFEPQRALEMLYEHRAGHRDNGHRLWSIYVYVLWRQEGQWLQS